KSHGQGDLRRDVREACGDRCGGGQRDRARPRAATSAPAPAREARAGGGACRQGHWSAPREARRAGSAAVNPCGTPRRRHGTATAIVNGKAVEVPPSGAGLNTVTCAVPGVRMSVARIVAWSSVVRRTVVGRFAPFQRTTELETKLLPFTFKTKPPVPAATMA